MISFSIDLLHLFEHSKNSLVDSLWLFEILSKAYVGFDKKSVKNKEDKSETNLIQGGVVKVWKKMT